MNVKVASAKSQARIEHPLTAFCVFLSLLIPCKFPALVTGIAGVRLSWNRRNLSILGCIQPRAGVRFQIAGNCLETILLWTAMRTIQSKERLISRKMRNAIGVKLFDLQVFLSVNLGWRQGRNT